MAASFEYAVYSNLAATEPLFANWRLWMREKLRQKTPIFDIQTLNFEYTWEYSKLRNKKFVYSKLRSQISNIRLDIKYIIDIQTRIFKFTGLIIEYEKIRKIRYSISRPVDSILRPRISNILFTEIIYIWYWRSEEYPNIEYRNCGKHHIRYLG